MRVKFNGGREASGVLKGYDALLNLVLDGATEYLKGGVICSPCVLLIQETTWKILLNCSDKTVQTIAVRIVTVSYCK